MTDGRGDLKLPLPLFNPMGKDHVAAMLDRLIAAGAEGTARSSLPMRWRPPAAIPCRRLKPDRGRRCRR